MPLPVNKNRTNSHELVLPPKFGANIVLNKVLFQVPLKKKKHIGIKIGEKTTFKLEENIDTQGPNNTSILNKAHNCFYHEHVTSLSEL